MKRSYFPDPQQIIDPDGIALISDEMSVPILVEAYSLGIFPWPHSDLPILWFCPEQRGILDFNSFHQPKSLKKYLKKQDWQITFNQSFSQVIFDCAQQNRPEQDGTWITDRMIKNYIQLHQAGHAHSVECWEGQELIGGLYGVFVEGSFSGESMFFKKQNASKACLLAIVKFLRSLGLEWMDIQMVTDHMKRFGGREVPRGEFLQKLQGRQQAWKVSGQDSLNFPCEPISCRDFISGNSI